MSALDKINKAFNDSIIHLEYEDGEYVAADLVSEDRLRDVIARKRFNERNLDGVIRLASQQGYCIERDA